MYDLIILGAGPAGITASVYAARKKMDFLVISTDIGGQAARSGDIENYTGYQFVTGPELAIKFEEHMTSFGININMPEKIIEIRNENNLIKTITEKNEYLSKTLIIATGKRPRELNVNGEKEYKNKGVTYCATCDGPIFSNKDVAIIGGGNSALDASLQMMNISPKVHIINITSDLTGDPVMIEKVTDAENVIIHNNSEVKNIYGDIFVNSIEIKKNGNIEKIKVEGVLVEIGLMPNSEFAGFLKKNKHEEIIVDCFNKTSIEGVFAAGDVTNVPEKQIIIAAGEGSKALLGAFKYLSTHKF
ncbi:MAG: FAD-dependent oxidoreductase [Candidatus Aureabacteria bacterium]|nr:FAD-dependent oxidoreductase [Candidatus Auribacterota bacterium]